MAKGKGHQQVKHRASGKYSIQFARTVRKTGRWRGFLADKYIKYVKKKKAIKYD